jgi:hypothetical protein
MTPPRGSLLGSGSWGSGAQVAGAITISQAPGTFQGRLRRCRLRPQRQLAVGIPPVELMRRRSKIRQMKQASQLRVRKAMSAVFTPLCRGPSWDRRSALLAWRLFEDPSNLETSLTAVNDFSVRQVLEVTWSSSSTKRGRTERQALKSNSAAGGFASQRWRNDMATISR